MSKMKQKARKSAQYAQIYLQPVVIPTSHVEDEVACFCHAAPFVNALVITTLEDQNHVTWLLDELQRNGCSKQIKLNSI